MNRSKTFPESVRQGLHKVRLLLCSGFILPIGLFAQPSAARLEQLEKQATEAVAPAAVSELIAIARGGSVDEAFRAQAVATLRQIARLRSKDYHASVVPALVEWLDDLDPAVRREAALTAGAFGAWAEPAVPALLRRMERDRGKDVALFAAESLGLIGRQPEAVLPELLRLVPSRAADGSARWARGPELDAIGRFGGAAKMAVPALEGALADAEPAYAVRAARALAKIEPSNAALGRALQAQYARGNAAVRLQVLLAIKEVAAQERSRAMQSLVDTALRDQDGENRDVAIELKSK